MAYALGIWLEYTSYTYKLLHFNFCKILNLSISLKNNKNFLKQ